MRRNMRQADAIQSFAAEAEHVIDHRRRYLADRAITEQEQQHMESMIRKLDDAVTAIRQSAREVGYLI